MKLNRKGYARIYTDKPENIDRIKAVIKDLDEFEYGYIPDELITVFNGSVEHVYNHKFDSIDMDDLMVACWKRGIHAFYSINPEYPHIP
jgi:hypothetical protein